MQESQLIVLLISTFFILLVAVALIVLFSSFQKRKNSLLEEQKRAKEDFEREITKTQIEIREETLRNISWELHDNIGQLLTLAKIQLQSASLENINDVKETLSKGLVEVRSLSKLINPESIKKIQLREALQLEIDRFNRLNFIKSSLQIKGREKIIKSETSIIIFRILQEFFSNTIKHSKAQNLNVTLEFSEGLLVIIAKDDGVGFSMEETQFNGIGLENIKNRAKMIHANASFSSEINKGTTLEITYNL
jgi:signal transduction histidine kinase